jgi:hypothetical protein
MPSNLKKDLDDILLRTDFVVEKAQNNSRNKKKGEK